MFSSGESIKNTVLGFSREDICITTSWFTDKKDNKSQDSQSDQRTGDPGKPIEWFQSENYRS